ncbi:MAG: YdeI/OmpD-associated family protein [Chitinophagaceae bacterium]|jgi:uncharacterized protein YdeI (YjbR/CyaY-like superfamily)|nr:YdeI/OmpD-associated family protein [Chitinophagaceae bacterium]
MAAPHSETEIFYAPHRDNWRQWLAANHQKLAQVWLVQHRKKNPEPCVGYEEAVQEALCFGWIDSKPQKKDDHSYLLFFSKRKPKSVWSASNKKRVEKLIRDGLMMPAGLEAIDLAKQNGSWSVIDEAEAFVMPADLRAALDADPSAAAFFEAFPPSTRRGIYTWISLAKTGATRLKRIEETVKLAAKNIRANQWQPKK